MKTHAWKTLKDEKLSPAQQARVTRAALAQLAAMPLQELRQARELTQGTLADTLEVAQSEVSRIEKRTDMYIGTLRRYIEAMGGELDIVARFPDGAVRITQFEMAPA